jgi:uncharacterized protein YegP (UPF0339 family)
MEHPKFVVQKSGRHIFFQFTAPSGTTLLNSELHNWRGNAEDALASVKANAPLDARYDRRKTPDGQSYFVLLTESGQVLGTSEMFTSQGAMEAGIASVKANAPGAGVEL